MVLLLRQRDAYRLADRILCQKERLALHGHHKTWYNTVSERIARNTVVIDSFHVEATSLLSLKTMMYR